METLFKYPRTKHLLYSEGRSDDDKVLKSHDHFINKEVIVTLKMDGENANLYSNYVHARSLTYSRAEYRSWINRLHSEIKQNILFGWRLCGENMAACHSVAYKNLKSYFYLFSIWNEKNECLSWKETEEWANLLNLVLVPVLYRGIWNESIIKSLYQSFYEGNEMEGYVVRLADSFKYEDFGKSVAKFVRKNHVKTDKHWTKSKIIYNELEDESK